MKFGSVSYQVPVEGVLEVLSRCNCEAHALALVVDRLQFAVFNSLAVERREGVSL